MNDNFLGTANLVGQIFTIQNFVFCIAIWAIVFFPRRFITLKFPQLEKNKYYNGLILPVAPLLVGVILAVFIPSIAPAMFVGKGAVAMFGLFCGLMSSHVYKIVKSLLKKAGDDSPDSTVDGS